MLFAVLEAERLADAGAVASYCVVRAAERHAVDPYAVAVHWLAKLLSVQRARRAVAAMQEGDRGA
ncbi:MAG: hypothetical protein A3G81_22505 [Betaproteobacteria bacterium RIFCSPLOWO2_12_FULL_65_14]|nr:MAG: hypothetical protein A3G81_22505 [Betaproteobacteria bacterium RIFCSPLOWO2_12_FULL_65_14]